MEKCVTERFWKAGMEEAQELNLRKAFWSDCRFLFRLRNEDEVRKNSFQTSEIPYSSHENWFAQKLQDFNTVIYILERNGQAVGQVRADRQERTAEISYALCREARGRGLSRWMLSELENRLREDGFCSELYAEVKSENIASQKIFQSLGYREKIEEYGFSYTKHIPLFSILMCTYHSSMTLGNALDSARHQTCQNWELVILDNGSKDETITVLQEYERIDERIHVIYRDSNVGWRKGISLCLEKASGQYMMFLGADDYLASDETLQEVTDEIRKNHPDIVWTGCGFAVWEDGAYRIAEQKIPPYRIYEQEDKLQIFAELMQKVYYNSVMHYVRIDFLKQYGIDFYEPYYGDCEGMTEAIARAGKMVVMDRMEYVLTTNTSQTATRVCFDYNTERQWKSIRQVLSENTEGKQETLSYVAGRVLDNLVAICQSIVLGEPLTDRYMNPIERGFAERFLRVEEMISNDAMAEMMYWAGRESYAEYLLGAAGVAYWSLRKQQAVIKTIDENSRWMSRFVHLAMRQDENGEIVWKTWISRADGEQLKTLFERKENRHLIGAELLLRNNVEYEESKQRQDIYEMLKVCIEKGGGCHR